MLELCRYQGANGDEPFSNWFSKLRDNDAKAKIRMRLHQLASGHFGDWASVGDGVIELRIHFRPGYRIYCGRYGPNLTVLLCGGSKDTQSEDIRRAKNMWADWRHQQ